MNDLLKNFLKKLLCGEDKKECDSSIEEESTNPLKIVLWWCVFPFIAKFSSLVRKKGP